MKLKLKKWGKIPAHQAGNSLLQLMQFLRCSTTAEAPLAKICTLGVPTVQGAGRAERCPEETLLRVTVHILPAAAVAG